VANNSEGPARGVITAAVFKVFLARPGSVLHVDELSEVTGYTKNQVQSCVLNMRRRSEHLMRDIEVVINGSAWRYVPNRDRAGIEPTAPLSQVVSATTGRPVKPATERPVKSAVNTGRPLYEELFNDTVRGLLLLRSESGGLFIARPVDIPGSLS